MKHFVHLVSIALYRVNHSTVLWSLARSLSLFLSLHVYKQYPVCKRRLYIVTRAASLPARLLPVPVYLSIGGRGNEKQTSEEMHLGLSAACGSIMNEKYFQNALRNDWYTFE